MNLNQLEYFVAVAETLNFTRAAERCYISQTAMTQQIRSLEKSIGVPLFDRDSHHVQLTAAGSAYLNEARAILSRSNEAIRIARLADEGVSGELTLGFISGYGHSDFIPILRRFRQSCPGIQTTLLRGNSSVLTDHLVNQRCDFAFTISPFQRTNPLLEHRHLRRYPVMAVLPAGHKLSRKQAVTYSDLEHCPFIMMQPTDRPKDQMEESLLIYRRGGYLPQIAAIEGEPETLMLMIAAGLGVSVLPEYITRPYENSKELAILPMVRQDGAEETVDFEVCWLSTNTNPALERLLSVME
ncbi:MAG: LysR family transcriptional regulator [Clostridia bacterium]|nr:LysR family transcriptional regulator [Clostridia bacterium]